ncbi:PREDICTED: uncharacterized protein LOC107340783 [Acropora digitifera]|uniref:uncharacterized protein LOC107340783 n=1 Tax=Acropora digitifera TaxID=70779 RepID=UPI00077A8FC9|nr:PREDICTED: uncharacterized protein LOC107340783 [Acropora digitifera]
MAQSQKKLASVVYRAGTEQSPSFDFDDKIDQVWLVTDPRLYFPLNQDISKSIRGQEGNSLEKVYLWKAEIINSGKDLILKEKFDGVCQVELTDSVNTKYAHKIGEIQAILKTFEWQKTTVSQCKGGLSLMNLSPLVQAVTVYMRDHYPTTPKELNFHAELKAASLWCWSDDYHQLVMKKVPFDDCRLTIAAKNTLNTWMEEKKNLQTRINAKKVGKGNDSSDESADEQLSDIGEAIVALKNYLGDDKKVKTHFLSFTLDKSGIQKSLDDFKEKVSTNCSECEGIDVIVFQSETKIHLTFGMMMLLSNSVAEKAKELFSQCCEQVVRNHLEGRGVRVELKGVEYVYDDHAGFGVLYAKATTRDGSDRLQNLADGLVEKFVARGLMKEEYDTVNIRAPLMKCNQLTESAAKK